MTAKRRTKTAGKPPTKSPEPPAGGREQFLRNPLRFELLVAVLVMIAAICVLYPEHIFQNAIFFASDNQAAASFTSVGKAALKDGVYPVWNPYVFAGMPSFASLQYTPYVYPVTPILGYLTKYLFFPQYTWMLFHTLLIGLGVFWLLRDRGVHYLPAMAAGVAMMWMPNLVAVGSHGHGTQACASGYLPIALLLWDRVWRGKGTITNGAALLIVLGLSMLRAHLQISYYTYALVALYILFYAVVRIIDGVRGGGRMPASSMLPRRWMARLTGGGQRYTGRAAGAEVAWAIVVFAVIVGGSLMMSSVLHLPVQDYAQYSIRGASEGGGADYEYATSWSLHPVETLTFLFPYAYGFGNDLYFGRMPFTDYPNYLGLVVFAFAVAALFLVRTRFVKFLAFVALVATFTAFGKFLPILYDPLFNFAPYFNKFRIPVMVLIVQQLAVALLFGIGFDAILRLDRARGRSLALKALVVSGVVFVLALATQGYWSGGFAESVAGGIRRASSAQQQAALAREVGEMLGKDLVRFGVMCLALSGLVFAFFAGRRVPALPILLGVVLLCALDLYLVNRHILHPERFRGHEQLRIIQDGSVLDRFGDADDVVEFLRTEKRHFRVFPMESPQAPFSGAYRDNRLMNFGISSIGGYQPAKLKAYEEFLGALSASLSRGDFRLVDMLNVRYIVSGAAFPEHPRFRAAWQGADAQGRVRFIYENMGALPRVHFVDRYRVASGDEALSILGAGTVDVREEVVLEREPPVPPRSREGSSGEITEWGFNEIRISAQVDDACLLVLSEVYYPDWKVTVNGEAAEVLRANHIVRAVALSAGTHELVFQYDTSLLRRGVTISVSTFAVSFLALIGSMVVSRSRRKRGSANLHTDV